MERIRIRLNDFLTNGTGLDLTNVIAVRLDVGPSWGTSKGRIVIDELMLSNYANNTITGITLNDDVKIQSLQVQNFPNPFNNSTSIEIFLPEPGFVTLKIYNFLGEEVATLVSKELQAGKHKYNWNADGLSSGVYLYRIVSGKYSKIKKMILLK